MTEVDVDPLMADIRERVREDHEHGIYGAEVEAMLRAPLPGGRAVFADELVDPLAARRGCPRRGLHTERVVTRLLPYATRSRLPMHPLLIRAYLALPALSWLFGKQTRRAARRHVK